MTIRKEKRITIRIDADIAEILARQRAAAALLGEEVTIAEMIRRAIRKMSKILGVDHTTAETK